MSKAESRKVYSSQNREHRAAVMCVSLMKRLPAATVNVPVKKATNITIWYINYILKVMHRGRRFSVWLQVFDDFHRQRDVQHSLYLSQANPGLKIGERYRKLLNGTHTVLLLMWPVKVKALACRLPSVVFGKLWRKRPTARWLRSEQWCRQSIKDFSQSSITQKTVWEIQKPPNYI